MTNQKSTKQLLVIVSIIVGLILLIAIVVGVRSSMQSVQTFKPSRLNDKGWTSVTSVLDEGGVALFTEENGRGLLIVGKGLTSDGTDYRDCYVKFQDRRVDGQRVMYIDIQPFEENDRNAHAPDDLNRPLSIYRFKLQNADRIELRIDGRDEAFTSIVHEERQNILR